MTARTIHVGVSFAIVLVAYWTYALLAVPLIEPPPPAPKTAREDRRLDSVQQQENDLRVLFGPRDWQLHDPKIINYGQGMLLWQTYKNHGNGWVDLTPLTIIYVADESESDPRERLRHAVVVDAPEGANLRFDRPLDLNKGGIGRLIEGRLRGPVQVRSQGKRPDHQDDLLVATHDVDLSEQRISTANDVDFRWGLNSGRGRDMEIKLLPRLGFRDGNQQGPNVGGIEQISCEHVERLHLDLGSLAAPPPAGGPAPSLAGGAAPSPQGGPAAAAGGRPTAGPAKLAHSPRTPRPWTSLAAGRSTCTSSTKRPPFATRSTSCGAIPTVPAIA